MSDDRLNRKLLAVDAIAVLLSLLPANVIASVHKANEEAKAGMAASTTDEQHQELDTTRKYQIWVEIMTNMTNLANSPNLEKELFGQSVTALIMCYSDCVTAAAMRHGPEWREMSDMVEAVAAEAAMMYLNTIANISYGIFAGKQESPYPK